MPIRELIANKECVYNFTAPFANIIALKADCDNVKFVVSGDYIVRHVVDYSIYLKNFVNKTISLCLIWVDSTTLACTYCIDSGFVRGWIDH